MPTSDDFPGPNVAEEVQLEDRTGDGNPTVDGSIRFAGDDFVGKTSTGVKSLTAAAGGGITEGQHEGLDRLTHRINESGYEEYTYSGQKLTGWILWTDSGKTTKIREEQYTWSGNKISTFVEIQYDGAGVEKKRNTLNNFSWTGNRLDNNDRTHV
jgi:hypothetical protein